jgi:hypothetical protein
MIIVAIRIAAALVRVLGGHCYLGLTVAGGGWTGLLQLTLVDLAYVVVLH